MTDGPPQHAPIVTVTVVCAICQTEIKEVPGATVEVDGKIHIELMPDEKGVFCKRCSFAVVSPSSG